MKKKMKIVLMVDAPTLSAYLKKEFQKAGHIVLSVTEEDPLQKVFDEVPHLVVIEDRFGADEGKGIATSIKEDFVLQSIPVILLIGSRDVLTQKESSKIDFYLNKEEAPSGILRTARKALAMNTNELDSNPLTHLPGSRSSMAKLEKVLRSKKPFAVCCVDLSDLAAFNSAYGDSRGDQIIIKLGKMIQAALRQQGRRDDFVGHLGGDDFIIVTHPDHASAVSENIIQNFDSQIKSFYDPKDFLQGGIIQRSKEGVSKHYPVMSVTIALIQNDIASISGIAEIGRITGELKKYMRQTPGSCYFRYQPQARETSAYGAVKQSKNGALEESGSKPGMLVEKYGAFLSTILKDHKIYTVYQPIVDLRTKTIMGYEALTRGQTDTPLDNPELMFNVAREAGKIKELDCLCVEYALQNGQHLEGRRKLFINLNHETLIDEKIMKKLFNNSGKIQLDNIVIEVTEQSILRSFEKMKRALIDLRSRGVSIAIDDVGGGAVSLRDVAIIRPDFIKFDRSLVRQIDTNVTKQQIVLSMILFANGIKAATTAEGIETKEEYETVMACGIYLGQGYYFAKPGKAFPDVLMFKQG